MSQMQKISFRQIFRLNLLFWSAWLLFYGVVLYVQIAHLDHFIFALFSSSLVTFPLFFLGLALWPLCRWIKWGQFPAILFILLHFVLANLFAILWLGLCYGAAYLLLGNLLFHMMDVPAVAGWQYPQGLLKYMVVSGFYYALIFQREIKTRELRESNLRLSLRESEWKALKSQLNPHFLFNALNSISALITTSPGSARQMLVRLSEILRRILTENPTQTTTLEAELAFLHQYLDLEKIRLQDRLRYDEEVDPALLSCPIPVMVLQPLLENAIKHGISNLSEGGWIRLKINRDNHNLVGVVENSLASAASFSRKKGDGQESTGLRNLQQRLALLYGGKVQFSAQPIPEERLFRVQFHFPVNGEPRP